jgi:hypothetical protein
MSEGFADEHHASAPRPRPGYGEGRLADEPRSKDDEHLDRGAHWRLAVAIFAPVVAFYAAIIYGLSLAANAIF